MHITMGQPTCTFKVMYCFCVEVYNELICSQFQVCVDSEDSATLMKCSQQCREPEDFTVSGIIVCDEADLHY